MDAPILYVVATPIGNLSDLTPRVRETLALCGLILAEDTRVTRGLLSHMDLHIPMLSLNRHNEDGRVPGVIARMLGEGMSAAVVTDAGTPCVSDPGHLMVAAAHEAGIRVVPIAGSSAVTAALSASGFDARAFAYYGFPPRERKRLDEFLERIYGAGPRVAVFNESPHRVVALLERVAAVMPGCPCAVHCDLTKLYERIDRGAVEAVLERLLALPNREKGEYTVVLDMPEKPAAPAQQDAHAAEQALLRHMLEGMDARGAQKAVQAEGFTRSQAYDAALRLKGLFAPED